jgi:hypothetical protein
MPSDACHQPVGVLLAVDWKCVRMVAVVRWRVLSQHKQLNVATTPTSNVTSAGDLVPSGLRRSTHARAGRRDQVPVPMTVAPRCR